MHTAGKERRSGMKSREVKFRLSEEERNLLQIKAGRAGLKISPYLRMLIRDRPGDHPEIRKQLKQLNSILSGLANNVNQITKANNAFLYSAKDKQELNQNMTEIKELMRDVYKKLSDNESK